jgi:hypothetical protein
MKNALLLCSTILFLFLTSCGKDNSFTNINDSECPNGSNGYISALANGESYNSGNACDIAQYSNEGGTAMLFLGDFGQYQSSTSTVHIDELLYITLVSFTGEIEEGCTEFLDGELVEGSANFSPFIIFYYKDFNYSALTPESGKGLYAIDISKPVKICIDRLDGPTGKVQGTFSFTMMELEDSNNLVEFTNGKFDFDLQ